MNDEVTSPIHLKPRSRATGKLLFLAAILLACVFVLRSLPHPEKPVEFLHPVTLGLEAKDVQVALRSVPYHAGASSIGFTRILVVTEKGIEITFNDLNQLRGYVQIKTPEAALRFVRLRTSPEIMLADYPNYPMEMEVLPQTHLGDLPEFGLRKPPRHGFSGDWALLSASAYHAGGFTPVTVVRHGKQFVIRRWTLSHRYVRRIEETVWEDGRYQRTVLSQQFPPDLPDTRWNFPDPAY